jgi:parvulin-like peptidyl-prolyl isomerase
MAKRPTAGRAGRTQKRRSRAQREARIQRVVLIATAVVAVAIIGLLAFAVINQQVLIPRRAIATVDGVPITVKEFQEYALFEYYSTWGDQTIAQLSQTFGTQLDATIFAQQALDSMIEDILLQAKADELGITVSDEEIENRLRQGFGMDVDEPDGEPTTTPTSTPSGPTATPTATSTYVYTLTPSPTMTLEPGVTPTSTPTATSEPTLTPTPSEPPTATPIPSSTPTPVPVTEEDFLEAYGAQVEYIGTLTGIPEERVKELYKRILRRSILSEKLAEELVETDETKFNAHVAHILVETEEEALDALARIEAGEAFEEVAAEVSIDPSAPKGGDLGWFGPGVTIESFEEMAFSLPVGEISDPFQSEFGWHIIKVYDRVTEPTTSSERSQQQQERLNELKVRWRAEADIVIEDFWLDYMPNYP